MRIIILVIAAFFSINSYAGESLDKELEEAEKALKYAAKRVAELHAKGFEHGGTKKAMLGVLLDSEKMSGGVPISGTTPKSGAAQAGLQAGDKIVVIGGIDLSKVDDPLGVLSKHMKSVAPGDDVDVTYIRKGKRVDATITTQARSAHVMKMISGMDKNFDFDFDVDMDGYESMHEFSVGSQKLLEVSGDFAEYFDVAKGVVLTEADEGSELKGGDVLLTVNGVDIESSQQAIEMLAELDGKVEAKIKRRGRTRTVELNPHEFHGTVHKEVKVIKITRDD